ncbi:conserved hypothetical protein [Beutenbergia cavernae DSM 12333]|uniref:Copper transport outer membrane protein MctB n=1 Tax=Beutenbergia cavernae (strain ATCC BAA-8 / DSM 12333 / CCUG 43141 / JCM 11478 / NBRC 16432 / NCIMB 13614 / HKI 0122) TaxID=471853 RepID=C5BW02_BEUC1|nr:copper transporter [Beutenbergia cavernae]ACQ80603.1 conserved hypothetical protein [Beutenbergia cavernae DSM 12333]
MIDFRYHLVSLISVFLALAVGIVLGAGPLRDTIGDQLTGQVEQLREEKESLRADLERSQADLVARDAFVTGAAPQLLEDTLPERDVALVLLPGAEADVVEALTQNLELAGASVVGRVEVTTMWSDPSQRAYRSQIAANLSAYLAESPGDDATTEQILGEALGEALTATETDTDEPTANAGELLALLTAGDDDALVRQVSEDLAPADATIVVSAPYLPVPDEAPPSDLEDTNAAWVALASALAQTGEGSILAGYATNDGDVVAALRADPAAATTTSVDGIDVAPGLVTAPLALASAMAGNEAAQYGSGIGATEVMPPDAGLEPPVVEPDDGSAEPDGEPGGDGEDA